MERGKRKPFKNFVLKRSLQTAIVFQILFVMIMTGVITSGILAFMYNEKARYGSFYYMSNDVMQDLELTNILQLVLPALITAQLVSFLMALAIGLFSSRKVAVPIYKIEKWAQQLRNGNLKTRLDFRERRSMRDLTRECNSVTEFYKDLFKEIDKAVGQANNDTTDASQLHDRLKAIRETIQKVSYN